MCDPVLRVISKFHLAVCLPALLIALAMIGCERRKPVATTAPGGSARPASTSPATEAPAKFVAYYFHRTLRCQTCLAIEKQSGDAIESAYSGELSAGTLEWRPVNIEERGNEHFEQDFDLQTQSLVLVQMDGERVARWKLLPKVWDLVQDPYGFQDYVVVEVARFLGGAKLTNESE